MTTRHLFLPLIVALCSCQSTPPPSITPPPLIAASTLREDLASSRAVGREFAISTQGEHATKAAHAMISAGGNLIDAAVAASFVISVERPHSTGLGGGGFMLYREASSGQIFAIDFRERAPLRARRDMYLGADGKADPSRSLDGHSAVAVPGLVAGLIEIHARFGKLPLKQVVEPAIALAEGGLRVYPRFAEALKERAQVLAKDPPARALFLDAQGLPLTTGATLVQKDLGKTLRLIAQKGRDGFYGGPVARAIVQSQKKNGGLVTQKDLDEYKVIWRQPISATSRGFKIYSMPPPSSGGVHVIQFLKMTELGRTKDRNPLSAENLHLAASALQSAFADRARYLGDPDFVPVPQWELVDDRYLSSRLSEIPRDKARPAAEVLAGNPGGTESIETTHLSLMDSQGNAIATTQTINGWMGAAVVAPGTGVLLNNEMDDFAAEIGGSNLFGAIGGEPNTIAPRKTPLSSMSPTLVMKDDQPVMAVGAPGGTRIISCVAQTILHVAEYDRSLPEAVSAIRFHQQWRPDVLWIDPPGPGEAVLSRLREMGHDVRIEPVPCTVMAVARTGDGLLEAVADPRDIGTSAAQ